MPRRDIRRPAGDPPLAAGPSLDRVLELLEQRKLSATELRVLLALRERDACLADLADALDQAPREVTRAGRRLCMRGLIRWHHRGRDEQTRLGITSSGLATMRALISADAVQTGQRPSRASASWRAPRR